MQEYIYATMPSMSETDLSTGQVATRLGVIADTVRKWCRRGLFPTAYEVEESRGSVWMIPERDLEGFEPPKKTGRPPKSSPGTEKRATGAARASNGTATKKKGRKK